MGASERGVEKNVLTKHCALGRQRMSIAGARRGAVDRRANRRVAGRAASACVCVAPPVDASFRRLALVESEVEQPRLARSSNPRGPLAASKQAWIRAPAGAILLRGAGWRDGRKTPVAGGDAIDHGWLVHAAPHRRCRRRARPRRAPLAAASRFAPASARRPSAARPAPVTLEFTPADIAVVEARALTRWLPVSGTLQPVNQTTVKAKVSGEIRQVTVREGEPVKSGQVWLRFDTADLDARLTDRVGALESSRAQLALAEKTRDAEPGAAQAELHFAERLRQRGEQSVGEPGHAEVQRGAGAARAERAARRGGDGAAVRHRRQAPRAAGREGDFRRAAVDHRRPRQDGVAGDGPGQ